MDNPIISISNLTKSYDKTPVLKSLNWQVEQGDIVALLGRNGAGKSTLLELIMNLRQFENGDLKLWGKRWDKLPQEEREKIGFVAQDTSGFEWMKVKEFLSYLGGFFPQWNESYCFSLSDKWNLDPKKRIGDLSGGQKQILKVIQSLSIKPELLILDEPVAHLDPNMRRQFLSELIDLTCELNTTVIFSSHIVSDLERVANKVALLLNGQIDYYYEVEDLKANIAHIKLSATNRLEQSEPFADLINWRSQANGATATIAKPMQQPIEEIAANNQIQLEKIPMSLEDWYLEVSHAAS